MEEDLVQALLANAGVAALVGTAISWELRKQGSLLPAIVLHLISGPPAYTLTRRTGATSNLVQFDILAGGFLEAKTIYRALLAAFDTINAANAGGQAPGLKGCFVEDVRGDLEQEDGPQPTSGSDIDHCVEADVRVIHQA